MSAECTLLIVGGGPAGLAAARAYREREPFGRVAIVTDEHLIPYHRPPLTKELMSGESGLDALAIEPEEWFDRNRVELIGGRAVRLDPTERTVRLSGGRTLEYTTCVLATGAEPTRLTVPGADHPRVAVMRTLDDLRRLQARLHPGDQVAVIGSGFIGCETASSLRARGHGVDLVSSAAAPNVARLGERAAGVIAAWLADDGVQLHPGAGVESITHADGVCTLVAGSRQIRANQVVMATGVAPRSELAEAAGVDCTDGAIVVDAAMHTSAAGVLAAGDVALADNLTAGRRLRVEHWGDALGQGAVAGQTAAGSDAGWDAVTGFWSTIGDQTLKYVGWGDGFDELAYAPRDGGGFTVRYGAGGKLVGVLAHRADDDYGRAYDLIAGGVPWTS